MLNHNGSLSTSRSVTPSHAPLPPPPPPPLPPQSGSSVSARSRTGNAQLQRTDLPSIPSTSSLHSNTHPQAFRSQSSLGQDTVRLSASPSTSASLNGVDSRAGYGRQPLAGSSVSLAADTAQQPASFGVSTLQLPMQLASQQMTQSSVTQHSGRQQTEHQKGWRQQLDQDAESAEDGSIAAVHASQPVLPASGTVAELQNGVKKRWPTVQSNPLYQQADAAASNMPRPASAATTTGAVYNAVVMHAVVVKFSLYAYLVSHVTFHAFCIACF